jgi:ubiquinone/menaquinone biosynthesis C-methylase UbiE
MNKWQFLIASLLGFAFGVPCVRAKGDGQGILSATGVRGGLVVHVGCGDGKLTAELWGGESFLVCGLDTDPGRIDEARRHVREQQLAEHVSIHHFDGERLPFIDNLATLVVVEESSVAASEIMRVLHPYCVAYVAGSRKIKHKPDSIDEWTN